MKKVKAYPKSWEIQYGNKLLCLLSPYKPIVREAETRGIRYNAIIIDEVISRESKVTRKGKI